MNAKQFAFLVKDFLDFSGGFTPDEAADEVEIYTRVNCPNWCSEQELSDFFEEWAKEAK
jgi:hypothetical protein